MVLKSAESKPTKFWNQMQLPHETLKQMLQKKAFDYQEAEHEIIVEQKSNDLLKPINPPDNSKSNHWFNHYTKT